VRTYGTQYGMGEFVGLLSPLEVSEEGVQCILRAIFCTTQLIDILVGAKGNGNWALKSTRQWDMQFPVSRR
jgi:hypothetical protein